DRHASCEIAVIGGGYSGALIGFALTDAGADVLLVDRRDFGMGSTAASTALIEYQLDSELHEFIALAGERAAVRSYRLSRDAIDILESIINRLDDQCEWERKKGLHLASSPRALKSLRKEYRTRERYRFRVDLLSRRDLARHYAVQAPGAILYHDAAQVDPVRLTHTLIRCAARAGLRAYARTEISEFDHRRGAVVLKTRHGQRIRAKKVNTYALVSQPFAQLPRGLEECLFTETVDPYLYVRTTADNRVMMGGEDDPFLSAAFRERCLSAKTQALLRKFKRWFPALPIRPASAWARRVRRDRRWAGVCRRDPDVPERLLRAGCRRERQ
ncbi:MAG: NAD(P)/FAD-dependent oxidoreductase, partial [bacterium]